MEETIKQSFSETYDIVMHLEKSLYSKIPNSFIQMLKDNKDDNYKVNIDYSKNINEQNLLKDTRIILSLIYRDYICSKEKRQELIERDKIELKEYEESLNEKYDIENIFENRKKSQIQEQTQMIEYKETIFKKIINRLLRFLK